MMTSMYVLNFENENRIYIAKLIMSVKCFLETFIKSGHLLKTYTETCGNAPWHGWKISNEFVSSITKLNEQSSEFIR